MIAKSIRTKRVDRTVAKTYVKKARDNFEAMNGAFRNKNYNAVGTLAVQSVISAADAVCVFERGLRSISSSHGDICDLVMQTRLPESDKKCAALRRVIAKKNVIQYEGRNILAREAQDLMKWTERFVSWVFERVNE